MKYSSTYYKWEVLALLWIAYLLNQADRQIFNVVLPLIRADLDLTDTQVGFIATTFNLVFAILVPISGYLGDRISRKKVLTFSILLWSAATMLSGLSNGLLMFILFRSTATGMGEAMFGPANYAMIADYHKKTRAVAMGIHQTAYYIGIIASGLIAGYVGERYGWRNAFYIFGSIGVIHGFILLFRLKDKPKENDHELANTGQPQISFIESIKVLFKVPTAWILTIGFSGLIFVLTGYLTWTPDYLHETFSMNLASAGFHSMFYTHIAAFFGVLIAGSISDKLAVRNPANRILLQSVGLLAAAPFIVLMGQSTTLVAVYIGFAGFGFMRAFFDANTYTVLYDVIPEKYHASAAGVMQMIGFGIGSLSPVILGALKPIIGMSMGISCLSVIWIVCSILMFIAYKFTYLRDYKRAQA